MNNKIMKKFSSHIPSSVHLPEITIKAFLLGIVLAILMAASNAYLVLKVGMSISACIPAAVISMAVLKLFQKSNILENNLVQTTASAGEVVAASLAFTIPALVMIGYWSSFSYIIIAGLATIGGIFGVFMSVPLRRAMIFDKGLKFPEGVATAEVLKAGEESSAAREILFSGLLAAVIKFCQSGFQFLADSINIWGRVGSTVAGVTVGFSLALVGAGYVVGLEAVIYTFSGAFFAWFIGVPFYGAFFGLPVDNSDAYASAVDIWNSKIRIIGVGMMVFGGLWTLYNLIKPIRQAIRSSLDAARKLKLEGIKNIERTELDIPITYVAFGTALLILPLYILFDHIVTTSSIPLSMGWQIGVTVIVILMAFLISALGSAVASYSCGLLGSSNTPISGLILMGILLGSFTLLIVIGPSNLSNNADASLSAGGIVILLGAIIGCAVGVAGDNLQDLKAGYLVGATPWKQQVMLIVGVVASALILAPIFQLLFEAYGFGDALPREGMDPTQALSAPRAAIMAAVSQAIFTQSMDWGMVLIGFVFGILVIILNHFLKKSGSAWQVPIIAPAVGIYMPLEVTVPLFLGGILSYIAAKARKGSATDKEKLEKRGILFASGLISGEAVIGILLAIPFVAYQSTNVFRIVPDAIKDSTDVLGLVVFSSALFLFYRVATKSKKKK